MSLGCIIGRLSEIPLTSFSYSIYGSFLKELLMRAQALALKRLQRCLKQIVDGASRGWKPVSVVKKFALTALIKKK